MEPDIVRDLLNANVRLTEQIVTLASKVIDGGIRTAAGNPSGPEVPMAVAPQFSFSAGEDWEDIPELTAPPIRSAPMHVSEDEDDANFLKNTGQIDNDTYRNMLRASGVLNAEIQLEP